MITFEHISKVYPDGTHTVHDLTFDAPSGRLTVPVMTGDRVIAALSSVVPSYRPGEEQASRISALLLAEAGSLLSPPAADRTTKEHAS